MNYLMNTLNVTPTSESTSLLRPSHRKWLFMLGGILLVVLFLANIMIGSINISLGDIWKILLGNHDQLIESDIIWKIRIPRAIAAMLGGAYLAVSGLLLQVFFRNPIVGPFILGISSGATVMVSVTMLTTLTLGLGVLAPVLVTVSALVGSFAVMAIILPVASKVKNSLTLLIIGLMMGYLCSAITNILIAFAEKSQIKGFVLWQLGSFSGFKWGEIYTMLIFGGVIILLIYLLRKPLNAFLLGEEYAASMGVNIRLFRLLLLFCSCSLAGMVTSVAGPIAFIGLAIPHLTRLIFQTSNNNILIPGVIVIGAVVCGLCDFLARLLFSPIELPLSAITAFLGAPLVISLLAKKRVTV